MRDDKSSWVTLNDDVNSAKSWKFSDKKKADDNRNIQVYVIDEQLNEDEVDAKNKEKEEDNQLIESYFKNYKIKLYGEDKSKKIIKP